MRINSLNSLLILVRLNLRPYYVFDMICAIDYRIFLYNIISNVFVILKE